MSKQRQHPITLQPQQMETVMPSGVDSPVPEVLYNIISDLPYMGRGILRRDQHTILVQAGHIRSAGTGVAKLNVRARGTGSVLIVAGFGDCYKLKVG